MPFFLWKLQNQNYSTKLKRIKILILYSNNHNSQYGHLAHDGIAFSLVRRGFVAFTSIIYTLALTINRFRSNHMLKGGLSF